MVGAWGFTPLCPAGHLPTRGEIGKRRSSTSFANIEIGETYPRVDLPP